MDHEANKIESSTTTTTDTPAQMFALARLPGASGINDPCPVCVKSLIAALASVDRAPVQVLLVAAFTDGPRGSRHPITCYADLRNGSCDIYCLIHSLGCCPPKWNVIQWGLVQVQI